MVKMHYLVCYDISEDAVRYGISEFCKNMGLERIQYSVFFGKLAGDELKQLKIQVQTIISDSNANVHFIPICSSCESKHHVILAIGDDEENIELNTVSYKEIDEEIPDDEGVLIL